MIELFSLNNKSSNLFRILMSWIEFKNNSSSNNYDNKASEAT